MNGDFLSETGNPASFGGSLGDSTPSGASNGLLDRVLNTGLGVAGLFTNRTPAAAKTGTPGAPNWTLIAVVGGAIVLLLVIVMAVRK